MRKTQIQDLKDEAQLGAIERESINLYNHIGITLEDGYDEGMLEEMFECRN